MSCEPISVANRWSKKERKRIEVPMPKPFKVYNGQMGGVDLFDQFVANYRVRIRSEKWWWPFLAWTLNASVVNSWRLYRQVHLSKIQLLPFVREISLQILGTYGRQRPSHSLSAKGKAGNYIRLDTYNHVVVKGLSKYCRCKQCGRRTCYKCEKCNVSLHPECMQGYHM